MEYPFAQVIGSGSISDPVDLLPTPAVPLDLPRPSVMDVVRMCPPSAELVALLTKLTLEHHDRGETELACELLSLALCARSARRGDRPFG